MLATGERETFLKLRFSIFADLLVISQWDLRLPHQEFEGETADKSETCLERPYFLRYTGTLEK